MAEDEVGKSSARVKPIDVKEFTTVYPFPVGSRQHGKKATQQDHMSLSTIPSTNVSETLSSDVKLKEQALYRVLSAAACGGHTDIVKILLDKGADPNENYALYIATCNSHTDIVKILLDKGADPIEDKAMQAGKQMGNKDTVEIIKKWQDTKTEQNLHRPDNLVSLPEPTPDAAGDISETERMIEIVKRQNLEDFKMLEKKLSTTAVNILHIVAVYGCSEMVECMRNWDGIQWDEQCELSEIISEDALEEIPVRKATALYIATCMDKTKLACSLIKCAGEDNIRCCYQNIQLSKPIEEVFMRDRVGKLEREHRDLNPVIVPGHRVGKDRKRERMFIVYSKDVMRPSSYGLDGLGLVLIRNPYFITGELKSGSEKHIGVIHDDRKKPQKALSIYRRRLWETHSNLNVIRIHSVTYGNNMETIEKPCIVLYCSTKGVVPLGEPDFPKRLEIDEHDSVDVIVRDGYFRRGGGYRREASIAQHNTLKMGCNIGRLIPEEGQQHLSGTLGPFVRFQDNIGFLTCAHVLFQITNPSNRFNFPDGASSTVEVVQPSIDIQPPPRSACGVVNKAIFDPTLDPSIDVAVVQLTDDERKPTAGQFANAKLSKLKIAGFDELPEYNSGSYETRLNEFSPTQVVYKFGSSSDVTKGMVDMYGTDVRPLSTDGTLPDCHNTAFFQNQCTISGTNPEFTLGGDSGAPVFMRTPGTNALSCIGIVIGQGYLANDEDTKNYPVAVFTPIDAVMQALGDEYEIAFFTPT